MKTTQEEIDGMHAQYRREQQRLERIIYYRRTRNPRLILAAFSASAAVVLATIYLVFS